jgi:hypothetical protein
MKFKEFWALIDSGVDDPKVVDEKLKDLPEAELVDFYWTYQELVDLFMEDQYAEQIPDPYSEDTHRDIAEWVIAQGRDFHDDVSYEPSKFPPSVPKGKKYNYVNDAAVIYEKRFGQPIRMQDEDPPDGA